MKMTITTDSTSLTIEQVTTMKVDKREVTVTHHHGQRALVKIAKDTTVTITIEK